jgi:hypothetical protein
LEVVPTREVWVHHSFSLRLQSWCPDRAQWRIERFTLASGIDPGLVY